MKSVFLPVFFVFSQFLVGQLAPPGEWGDYHKGMLDLFDDSPFFEKVNGGIARFRGLARDQEGFQFYVEDSHFAYSLSVYKDYPRYHPYKDDRYKLPEGPFWKIAIRKVHMRRSADKLEKLIGYRGNSLVVYISAATSSEAERKVLDLIARLNVINDTITGPVKIDGLKGADTIAISHMRILISRGSGDSQKQIMCEYDCPYIPKSAAGPKPLARPSPFDAYEAALFELLELAQLGVAE